MFVLKLIIYILLMLYFSIKLYAGIRVYWKVSLIDVQKMIPLIKSKKVYLHGIIENTLWLILISILYFS